MDPRAARTRTRLQQALLALALERDLDEITIGDVAERAGVNRSSFYQHYSDKDTVLADSLESVLDDAAAQFRVQLQERPVRGMPAEFGRYLAHVADFAPLYRRVLGAHGSAVVSARLRQRVEEIVAETVVHSDPRVLAGVPIEVVSAGIAGSVLGVIAAWVSRDPLPPVQTAADWMESVLQAPARMLADE